jgi:mannose/fructose/N-acetylgalactosamine-specific phosphotransferase system component IID
MDTKSERLRDSCELAVLTFRKLNHSDFDDIIAKLEFCIGSYNYDKNPAGLVEYGYKALEMLKEIKKTYPRKVSKELLAALEDSLT